MERMLLGQFVLTINDMDSKIDIAYRELERLASWIGNADTKASIMIALNSALLALLFGNAKDFVYGCSLKLYVLGFGAFLMISLYFSLRVLLPDIKPRSKHKLFFFGTISTLSSEEYKRSFLDLNDPDMLTEILDQVHVNSVIATNKFGNMKSSLIALGIGVVFAAVGLLYFYFALPERAPLIITSSVVVGYPLSA